MDIKDASFSELLVATHKKYGELIEEHNRLNALYLSDKVYHTPESREIFNQAFQILKEAFNLDEFIQVNKREPKKMKAALKSMMAEAKKRCGVRNSKRTNSGTIIN